MRISDWSSDVCSSDLADLMLSVAYQSDAPYTETFWQREAFDQLLIAARGELDVTKRKQLYYDLQELIWQAGGALTPMISDERRVGEEGIRNGSSGWLP